MFRRSLGFPKGKPSDKILPQTVRDLTKLEEWRAAVDENQRCMLGVLGFPRDFIEGLTEGGYDKERLQALKWVWGLETARGRDRGRAVRACAKPYAALLPDGTLAVVPRSCRDRACPRCMRIRSIRLGKMLRSACEMRAVSEDGLQVFVTLTQPKKHCRAEGATGAVDRVLKAFSRLTRKSSRRANEELRSICVGGVRSLEAVWSGQGKKHWSPPSPKEGQTRKQWFDSRVLRHRVAFSGWHAHLHCVMELAPGVERRQFESVLRETWRWACPDSDPAVAVNVQTLRPEIVGQCAKYITKPFELPEQRARELFKAVHARRMVEGFGQWRGWKKWVPEPENPYAGAVFAHVDMRQLAYRYTSYEMVGRGSVLNAAPVAFKQWSYDSDLEKSVEKVVAVLPVGEVHERLKQAGALLTKKARDDIARRLREAEEAG